MSRIGLLLIVVPAVALLGGCPATDPGGSDAGASGDVFVQANGPSTIGKGQTASLSASLSEDVSDVSYRWFQTFGRAVTLQNADSAETTFVAPSLKEAAPVGFRVDATRAGSVLSSAELRLMLEADPDFGVDEELSGDDPTADPFPKVKLTTSKGDIIVELNREKAPLTVNNFLRYVDDGFYDGTIFHRVIPEFVVQGGGFKPGLIQKHTRGTIRNESSNGLLNDKGTIAMARTNDVDSATSQFFFNLKNNTDLDPRDGSAGYCVFGKIVQGMSVVDEIAKVTTHSENGFDDVPETDVTLDKAERFTGIVQPDDAGSTGDEGSDVSENFDNSSDRPGSGSGSLGGG